MAQSIIYGETRASLPHGCTVRKKLKILKEKCGWSTARAKVISMAKPHASAVKYLSTFDCGYR